MSSEILPAKEASRAAPRLLASLALFGLLGLGVWATRQRDFSGQRPELPLTALPSFETVPFKAAGWQGHDEPIKPSEEAMLGADATLNRIYKGPNYEVRLLVEARVNRARDQFHLPTVCMVAAGWSALKHGIRPISVRGVDEPIDTMWLFMTKSGGYMLVTYWFWNDEGYVKAPSALMRSLNAVAAWEKLRNASPRGALFLCYIPVQDPNELPKVLRAQEEFTEAILPHLDKALRASLPGAPGGPQHSAARTSRPVREIR